ncbi:DM13 domain-containing protein [Flavobacterium longum]|uniref:DM13 domain-containing protein n=1 Tax=Flavobacterium longum TaxID=1299340 RepID=UPI0039EB3BE4
MKHLLFAVAAILMLSCEAEGDLTRREIGSLPIGAGAERLYSGTFSGTPGIEASGTAAIIRDGDDIKLSFEYFLISAGPDLKVYLSTSASPDTFINLGALGNGMTQNYAVPPGVDFSLYNHVLIHCQQYNHLYAVAHLNPEE